MPEGYDATAAGRAPRRARRPAHVPGASAARGVRRPLRQAAGNDSGTLPPKALRLARVERRAGCCLNWADMPQPIDPLPRSIARGP